ncbi:MAG: hypothetical protein RQ760_11185 [Sedimentisphaerales bacterium]|nr:hypothetical protein [Sedimentisphaerales bacterium]
MDKRSIHLHKADGLQMQTGQLLFGHDFFPTPQLIRKRKHKPPAQQGGTRQ